MDEGKIISFRMPADEVDAFWNRVPRRKGTDVLAGLVRAYLAAGGDKIATVKPADDPLLTAFTADEAAALARHRDMILKVARVLDSGDERTIKAIVPNIELFDERLRSAPKSAGERRAAVNETIERGCPDENTGRLPTVSRACAVISIEEWKQRR